MDSLVYLKAKLKEFYIQLLKWELRTRANLAHFLLSGGENYPLALITYDKNGQVDTITYGRDRATLNFISNKLRIRNKHVYRRGKRLANKVS
jgi:hypothetical protein